VSRLTANRRVDRSGDIIDAPLDIGARGMGRSHEQDRGRSTLFECRSHSAKERQARSASRRIGAVGPGRGTAFAATGGRAPPCGDAAIDAEIGRAGPIPGPSPSDRAGQRAKAKSDRLCRDPFPMSAGLAAKRRQRAFDRDRDPDAVRQAPVFPRIVPDARAIGRKGADPCRSSRLR
jgi:hypothetical protein